LRRTDFLKEWNLDTTRRWRGARLMMASLAALAVLFSAMGVLATTTKARYAHTLAKIEADAPLLRAARPGSKTDQTAKTILDPLWLQDADDSVLFWAEILGVVGISVPKGTVLSQISSELGESGGRELVVRGTARSLSDVSRFAAALEASPPLSSVKVAIVGGEPGRQRIEFECRARLLFKWRDESEG
jgi:hypothetical protein